MNFMRNDSNSEYHLVEPPTKLTVFNDSMRWTPRSISYNSHPAYMDLIRSASLKLRLVALKVFFKSLVLLIAKRIIRYEMIPLDIRSGRGLSGRWAFGAAALVNLLRLQQSHRHTSEGMDVFEQLNKHGICVIELPRARFIELQSRSTPWFNRLAEVRGKAKGDRAFDESRSSVTRKSAPELFEAVQAILDESGATAGASRFLGRHAKLIDVNPQINDKSDTFWKRIFGDLPDFPKPKLAYHHRDASGGDLKAIFYMTDVDHVTGPFTFALGSHKMGLSRIDDWICEAQDQCFMSGTDLNARRHFAALPQKLRQKGAFGNDLTDDNQLADAIEKAQWRITGPRGSLVLFDTKGVHRGGMVEEGERQVITCVLG